jgi:hypothetical protein
LCAIVKNSINRNMIVEEINLHVDEI